MRSDFCVNISHKMWAFQTGENRPQSVYSIIVFLCSVSYHGLFINLLFNVGLFWAPAFILGTIGVLVVLDVLFSKRPTQTILAFFLLL